MSKDTVKALMFDLFGTVVDRRGSTVRLGTDFAPRHGLGEIDWHSFARAWRAAYGPATDRVRRKEMNRFWHRLDPGPDAEVYLGAARLLGVEPARVMVVAAHPGDLRARPRSGSGSEAAPVLIRLTARFKPRYSDSIREKGVAVAGKTGISPTRAEDFAEWYQEVVRSARMAENSDVRGCMVILPWGYELWENMRSVLDGKFKETGHENAYFPLFIPLSYLEKEAAHVEGFAKECAVVTHHRLEQGPDGRLVPAGELPEPLIVRPTSETIIGATFAKWVQSYRDLPLLINQWANVVRWEMRTRLFLRTAEFLWQEGHTAHETREQALEETLSILDLYTRFAHEYMAMPVIAGEKTESERFPGAVSTFSIEAMMQDRKALQAGTSHFLGQNFAKAAEIQYQSREGQREYVWTTSWGVSTRLVGALIMTHGDDDGMVMPPRLAPSHIGLLPIVRNEDDRAQVMRYVDSLAAELRDVRYDGKPVRVTVDERDMNAGERSWDWIRKGIPLRAEIGPRDMEKDAVFLARRDKPPKEKTSVGRAELVGTIGSILTEIQSSLYERALSFRNENTARIESKADFYDFFENGGGFAVAHWNGSGEVEERLKADLAVTIRAMPTGPEYEEAGTCPFSGEPSERRVVFAKSY